MSYHFSIRKNKEVTYVDVLDRLPDKRVDIAYGKQLELHEPMSGFCKFYIPEISSRGITVGLEEEEFDIGINVLSSKEDYVLALQLARVVAEITESDIEPEDSEGPISIAEFDAQFGEEWAESYKTQGSSSIRYLIQQDNTVISIGGCLRPCYIGPKLLAKLSNGVEGEEQFYHRTIEVIRSIQFAHFQIKGLIVPNEFVVTEKSGEEWQYIVLGPSTVQLVIKTDYILLFLGQDNYVKVPFDKFSEYATGRYEYLDEHQFVFPAMPMEEFVALMKAFGAPPSLGGPAPREKKWWEFWR
ncbi:MAG: hypothetical protein AAFV25_02145 [Bacteroidota bacterium]